MRRKLWAFLATIGLAVLAAVAAVSGSLRLAAAAAALAVAAGILTRRWTRRFPGPMPYFLRWVLLLPRGPHSPRHLERILRPQTGERILEVGPGVGIHALPTASRLAPGGVLDVLDVQQEMLENLKRRATQAGVTNIVAKRADAQTLPYPDHAFDAAYLISVLGELSDRVGLLRELRRVLKRDGRLVIGEISVDPDFISLGTLKQEAARAGFALAGTTGPRFWYFALFHPAPPLAPTLDASTPTRGTPGGVEHPGHRAARGAYLIAAPGARKGPASPQPTPWDAATGGPP